MRVRLCRWGNSAGIRIPKEELDRLGVGIGDYVEVEVMEPQGPPGIDLSTLPTFSARNPDGSPITLEQLRSEHRLRWEDDEGR